MSTIDLQDFVARYPNGSSSLPTRLQPEPSRPMRNFIPAHYFNALARKGCSEGEILLRWLQMFAPDVLAAIEDEGEVSL